MSEPPTPRDATLEPVELADREAALRLLGIDASRTQGMVAAAERGELDMSGLWHARRDDRLVGAAWGQRASGRTAFCWTPCLCDGEPSRTASRLQAAVDAYLDSQHVDLIQAAISAQADQDSQRLVAAGYRYLATLLYLACNRDQFPQQTPKTEAELVSVDAHARDRWEQLVARTYADTLDCEQLGSLRCMSDVIEGYRATGVYRAAWWLILRYQQADVGCLLLADHPEYQQAELMYVGLVPEVRGRGWGAQVTRYAQWLVAHARRERIVLAVDMRNWPARNMYAQTGFFAWDQRCVYVRTPAHVGSSP
ncbi:MAG: GNAT family N-acetyltransferase [Pirellulaceae bacterium]|jgi:ribosomal protein S18 acetylase RimI-like enzyme|nr:GNAT family N-acetyltransferase [Pirellulaceae bacterium]